MARAATSSYYHIEPRCKAAHSTGRTLVIEVDDSTGATEHTFVQSNDHQGRMSTHRNIIGGSHLFRQVGGDGSARMTDELSLAKMYNLPTGDIIANTNPIPYAIPGVQTSKGGDGGVMPFNGIRFDFTGVVSPTALIGEFETRASPLAASGSWHDSEDLHVLTPYYDEAETATKIRMLASLGGTTGSDCVVQLDSRNFFSDTTGTNEIIVPASTGAEGVVALKQTVGSPGASGDFLMQMIMGNEPTTGTGLLCGGPIPYLETKPDGNIYVQMAISGGSLADFAATTGTPGEEGDRFITDGALREGIEALVTGMNIERIVVIIGAGLNGESAASAYESVKADLVTLMERFVTATSGLVTDLDFLLDAPEWPASAGGDDSIAAYTDLYKEVKREGTTNVTAAQISWFSRYLLSGGKRLDQFNPAYVQQDEADGAHMSPQGAMWFMAQQDRAIYAAGDALGFAGDSERGAA